MNEPNAGDNATARPAGPGRPVYTMIGGCLLGLGLAGAGAARLLGFEEASWWLLAAAWAGGFLYPVVGMVRREQPSWVPLSLAMASTSLLLLLVAWFIFQRMALPDSVGMAPLE